jgi:hypothetical protein
MLTKENLANKIIIALQKQSQKVIAPNIENSQKEIALDLADAILSEIKSNGRCKIVINSVTYYGTIE